MLVLKQIHNDLPGHDKAQTSYIATIYYMREVAEPITVETGANLVASMIIYLEYCSWGGLDDLVGGFINRRGQDKSLGYEVL